MATTKPRFKAALIRTTILLCDRRREAFVSRTTKRGGSQQQAGSALAMTFRIEGGGKTVEGTMRVPDDDGTTHLLMMMHGLLKQVAESVPELCKAGEITVSAKWKAQNGADDLRGLAGEEAR